MNPKSKYIFNFTFIFCHKNIWKYYGVLLYYLKVSAALLQYVLGNGWFETFLLEHIFEKIINPKRAIIIGITIAIIFPVDNP